MSNFSAERLYNTGKEYYFLVQVGRDIGETLSGEKLNEALDFKITHDFFEALFDYGRNRENNLVDKIV